MTDLANDAAATFFSVLHPVFFRKATRIHPIQHRKRRLDAREEILCSQSKRSEPPVKTNHQFSIWSCCDSQNGLQLFIVHGQRFLDKHVLIALQRFACEFGVQIVLRTDNNQIHTRIVEHFIRTRNCVRESKSLANVVRRDPCGCRDRSKVNAFRLEVRQ